MRHVFLVTALLSSVGCSAELTSSSDGGASGGSCASAGEPVTLASGQTWPVGLAVDAHHVYWANGGGEAGNYGPSNVGLGSIVKVPLCGGSPTTLASGQINPWSVAVDATSVYWITYGSVENPVNGTVMKAPLAGGPATTLASGQSGPMSMAIDATSVYWVNAGDVTAGAVVKVPLDGGEPTTLVAGPQPFRDIALDAQNVYFTTVDGDVLKAPLDGGTPTTLATGTVNPGGLAVDATHVYWSEGGSVHSVPLDGGPSATLTPISGASTLAVDATSIYWSSAAGGSELMKTPASGGSAVLVATVAQGLGAIEVDSTSVYWVDYGCGAASLDGGTVCDGSVVKLTPK
jgi:hypothetical protein